MTKKCHQKFSPLLKKTEMTSLLPPS